MRSLGSSTPEANEERDVLLRRQKVLADIGESENLGEVLTEVCRLVAEAMGVQRAKVLQIEEGGASLLVRAGVGCSADVVRRMRIPMDERSSESYAINAGEPVISRDIHDETALNSPSS